MAKVPYQPLLQGYSFAPGPQSTAVELEGGAPRVRRTQLNSWGRAQVRWTVVASAYDALCDFRKANEGKEITVDLAVDSSTVREHRAILIPGSFSLVEKEADAFTVEAELYVDPEPV